MAGLRCCSTGLDLPTACFVRLCQPIPNPVARVLGEDFRLYFMLISSLPDADGSRCTLHYDESNQWLHATWRGLVDLAEALRGTDNYLDKLAAFPCPCLLNDNLALRGPWFDSVEWLERAWLPQAQRLGLRYVAHVAQADTHTDILTLTFPAPVRGQVELQIFYHLPEAQDWLRNCQLRKVSVPEPGSLEEASQAKKSA